MEWAAAFQIFVKFHFLRIDTNNGKVENYKFVKNSRKFITFSKIAIFTLYVLYCTFFSGILSHILEPPTLEFYGSKYTYYS